MKKDFKKLLVSAVMVPCGLYLAACGGTSTSTPSSQTTSSPTVESSSPAQESSKPAESSKEESSLEVSSPEVSSPVNSQPENSPSEGQGSESGEDPGSNSDSSPTESSPEVSSPTESSPTQSSPDVSSPSESESKSITIDAASAKANYGEFTIDKQDGYTYDAANNTYTFTSADTKYTISGYFNGQLVAAAAGIELKLNGAYLENDLSEVIYSDVDYVVSSGSKTVNYVVQTNTTGANDSDYAIYSNSNLELGGSGTLYVVGAIKHAVKANKKLTLKGSSTMYIQGTKNGSALNCTDFVVKEEKTFTAYLINSKNGVKADGSISIASGNFNVLDCSTAFKTDTDASVEHAITVAEAAVIKAYNVKTLFNSVTVPEDSIVGQY